MKNSPFGWIEISNKAQLKWIGAYLTRQSLNDSELFSSVQNHNAFGHPEMAKSLKAFPNEAKYREASRLMKNAWLMSQRRKKHGNPVSLPMSKETRKKLNTLAKARNQNQENTLIQIITDAINEQNRLTKQAGELAGMSKSQSINKQEDDQGKAQHAIDKLLDALAVEISHRCHFESGLRDSECAPLDSEERKKYQRSRLENSNWGEESSMPDSEEKKAYHHLVDKRVAEMHSVSQSISACYPHSWIIGPTLKERMEEQAITDGIEDPSSSIL